MEHPKFSLNEVLTKLHSRKTPYSNTGMSTLLKPYRLDIIEAGGIVTQQLTPHQKEWVLACEKAKKAGEHKPKYVLEHPLSELPVAEQIPVTTDSAGVAEVKTEKRTAYNEQGESVEPKEPLPKESKNVAGIKGVEAQRFNVKMPDNLYKAIYLEPEFVTALSIIAPDNRTAFFKAAVSNLGDRSPAGAIRGAIVAELLHRLEATQ